MADTTEAYLILLLKYLAVIMRVHMNTMKVDTSLSTLRAKLKFIPQINLPYVLFLSVIAGAVTKL